MSCSTWCTEGASSCAGSGFRICERHDENECPSWGEIKSCPAEAPFCSLGQCASTCVNECAQGESRCAGAMQIQHCGQGGDTDACTDWLMEEACPEGQRCETGGCRQPNVCTNECGEGQAKCVAEGVSRCGQFDADSCLDWSPPSACAEGQSCSQGVCSKSDSSPCAGVTCQAPPSACYAATGTCNGGSCSYAYANGALCDDDNACTESDTCENGTCAGKPKTCTNAPAAECLNATTLRRYSSSGSCAGGTCSYAHTDTICPGGCTNGVCSINGWTDITTVGAPSARYSHSAVWTGIEMIVWGGDGSPGNLKTGGRYNPITNAWTATATERAPSARANHTAVWTGTEMIVWGGAGSNTGGLYNPRTDSWTTTDTNGAPSGRGAHTAVWTGTEMIVWGGLKGTSSLASGGLYNPSTNRWTVVNTRDAPSMGGHTAVWTGAEMFVFGRIREPERRSLRSEYQRMAARVHQRRSPDQRNLYGTMDGQRGACMGRT
jgi:hypothetical protein